MPPKGKKAPPAEPPRVPRDLAEVNPLDGREGAIGIEHLEVQERVKELQQELVLFKISEATTRGDLELDLRDAGLEEIPEEAFDLPGLTVIDLSRNLLPNDVFAELADMPDLRAITLCSNQLTSTLPDTVASLPPLLEELSLDENVIENIPLSAGALSALTWVSLRRNILVTLPAGLLPSWKQLTHLDLRENKLKEIPSDIGECTGLRELLLTGNELVAIPETIGKCTALETLLANKNQIAAVPSTLGGCSSLAHLDLASNKLVEFPSGILSGLTSLVHLFLGGNKIPELPADIGACRFLEVLSVSTNSLKSLPEDIGHLAALREVYCGNNPMTSLPPTVTGWTQLEQGVFRNCKLKTLPPGIEEAWRGARLLDVRAKGKKDTCKLTTDIQEAMKKTRMVGVVWGKPKKGKKGKK